MIPDYALFLVKAAETPGTESEIMELHDAHNWLGGAVAHNLGVRPDWVMGEILGGTDPGATITLLAGDQADMGGTNVAIAVGTFNSDGTFKVPIQDKPGLEGYKWLRLDLSNATGITSWEAYLDSYGGDSASKV